MKSVMKWLIVLGLLSGCSRNNGEAYLDEYLYRLSNVLDVEQVDFTYHSPDLMKMPPLKVAKKPLARHSPEDADKTISLLDFLSLYGCELQHVVGANNAILGKLARPSQQLLYELKFLHFAPICLDEMEKEGNLELAGKLETTIIDKKQALPHKIWQTIMLGGEMRQFWKLPEDLGEYPKTYNQEVVAAMGELTTSIHSWLSGNYQAGWSTLEDALFSINYGDGGYLLKSLWTYQLGLDQANDMIEKKREILCIDGRPRFNQVAAQNVVQKIFVGEVQQWASQLSRRYYELNSAIYALESLFSGIANKQYENWRKQRDQLLEQSINSSKEHVKLLEILLRCGGTGRRLGSHNRN